MSRGDFTSNDARAISGISLLLNILDELSEHKEVVSNIGGQLAAKEISGQIERIQAIIGTSGNKEANRRLILSLKELNLEVTDEFPHQPTIEFLVHNVLGAYYDAVGAHFQGWEKIRQHTILKSLGSHTILDEPKLFRRSIFSKRKKRKRLQVKQEPDYLDDNYTGADDFEDEDEDEDF